MKVAKMKMPCWMSGVTRLDKVRNEYIIGYLGVQNIARKTKGNKLRQFEYVERRNYEDIVKKMSVIRIKGNLGELGFRNKRRSEWRLLREIRGRGEQVKIPTKNTLEIGRGEGERYEQLA